MPNPIKTMAYVASAAGMNRTHLGRRGEDASFHSWNAEIARATTISAVVALANESPPIFKPAASDPNRNDGQRKMAAAAMQPMMSGEDRQRRKRNTDATMARIAPIVSHIFPGHALVQA